MTKSLSSSITSTSSPVPHSRVHLVGHSFGAFVALRLASRHSERVASLALYEPVAFRMLETDDPALAEMHWRAEIIRNLVAAGSRQAAAAAFIDFWSASAALPRFPRKRRREPRAASTRC
jgi:pimeloyl-ACP methyl ester carboxylesterase